MTEKPEEKKVWLLVAAKLAFRTNGEPTQRTTEELDRALDSVGATTIERGYEDRSRTVEIAENKVDLLKKAVSAKYTVEKARDMNINI